MDKRDNNIYYVTVIMSTYNSHEYIRQQLDSLVNQKGVIINLFVRDDGSQDDTVTIIERYRDKFSSVVIVKGDNVGATASFYKAAELALESSFQTEYYAFCDQDDIWLDDKLITAINKIDNNEKNKPALYFSNLMMMNDREQHIGMLLDDKIVSKSRENALAAIYTYGCTCVFNHTALEMFVKLSDNGKNYIFHDNWLYSVCVFLGTVYYDNESYIRYRQTGKNVSGEKETGIGIWKQRIGKLFRLNWDKRIYESIAIELLDNFTTKLDDDDIKLLRMISTYRKNFIYKVKLILSKRMKTASVSKNICIVCRILIGRL